MRYPIMAAMAASLVGLSSGCATSVTGPPPVAVSETAAVEAGLAEFLAAFNALDQARFDATLADDVTLFFPSAPFPIRRVEGKQEVSGWFRRFFDSLREDSETPGIEPLDVHIQRYGDTAVATFHLGSDPNAVARRTLVLTRKGDRWLVAHLHGSALRSGTAASR